MARYEIRPMSPVDPRMMVVKPSTEFSFLVVNTGRYRLYPPQPKIGFLSACSENLVSWRKRDSSESALEGSTCSMSVTIESGDQTWVIRDPR